MEKFDLKTSLLSTIVYSHTVPKMTKLKKDKFFQILLNFCTQTTSEPSGEQKTLVLALDLEFIIFANF